MSTKARQLSERIHIDPDREEAPPPSPAPVPRPTVRPAGEWRSCLDDPAIVPGRGGYRSFYVEDTVFARYRAAVYWCARLADAEGDVGENMSVDIQGHMAEVALALEAKFNAGETFRPTPEQVKKPRRRRGTHKEQ